MGKAERTDKVTSSTGYYFWLSELCGPGSRLPYKVFCKFDGNIERAYYADENEYASLGFTEYEIMRLANKDFSRANRIIDFCSDNMVGALTYESEFYPKALFSLINPPPVLYYKGAVEKLASSIFITAVGTRICSESAFAAGYKISYKLAASGLSLVTGGALGIDSACTLGALDAGGFAVVLLGSGINILYPFENEALFARLQKQGLILTEFSPYSEPAGRHFPIRNRVMSALGEATLVVEAKEKSGALITAEESKKLGRRIYAMPGDVENVRCHGSNELIKQGAYVVTCAEDILCDYEAAYPDRISVKRFVPKDVPEMIVPEKKQRGTGKAKEKTAPPEKSSATKAKADTSGFSPNEVKVYEVIFGSDESVTADLIAKQTDLSQKEINEELTMLEIYGAVESEAGGTYKTV